MIDPNYMKNIPPSDKKSVNLNQREDRPASAPQSKKEFKTLMRKDRDDEGDEHQKGGEAKSKIEEETTPEDETLTKKNTSLKKTKDSIFSLSQSSSKQLIPKEKKEPVIGDDEEGKEEGEEMSIGEKKAVTDTNEKPKTAVFNPFTEKEEKQISNVVHPDELPEDESSIKTNLKDFYQPKAKGILPEKKDLKKLSSEDQQKGQNIAFVNPEALQKLDDPAIPKTEKPLKGGTGKISLVGEETDLDLQPPAKKGKEDIAVFSPNAFEEKPKEKVDTPFAQEQPDLTYANPMNTGTLAASSVSQAPIEGAKSVISPEVQHMMEQVIDKITTISQQGKTDTTVTIHNLPLFEGANLKISSFNSARGEFNISFDNLKPEALTLLQANHQGLISTMENKGFTVHILSMTTVEEMVPYTAEAQSFSREKGDEGGGEEPGQEQRGEQESEENE